MDPNGNHGCRGGEPQFAFDYVILNGMMRESDYKYWGTLYDRKCHYDQSKTITDFKLKSYESVPKKNSDALKNAVNAQPVSIGINADMFLQFYWGGVIQGDYCDSSTIDHGVLLVGYGKDERKGQLYWKIKNSWGKRWGEHGFFRFARVEGQGDVGTCGITEQAVVPKF